MSIKVVQNDFTRKIKDFDTLTKTAYKFRRFGQINCCQRLWKVAQCPINRPIWSHWRQTFIKAESFSVFFILVFNIRNILFTHCPLCIYFFSCFFYHKTYPTVWQLFSVMTLIRCKTGYQSWGVDGITPKQLSE